MKRCLTCSNTYPSSTSFCSACGVQPGLREGFRSYAPDLALDGGGFRASYFADLAQTEAEHFWFRARNRLILWALRKYCPAFCSFLEIGCGTGYVLSGIAKTYPAARLHGSEIFTAGLVFAAAREPEIDLMQMDARNIPFVDEFDAIGAFDVLEHIKEDEHVLDQIHQALKPRGVLLLTVPQHAWLWSQVDQHACHVRRYSAQELRIKVKTAGFEILRTTSFVSILFPLMCASRILHKKPAAEMKISPRLERLLERVLNTEVSMIRRGVNFPIGGSRLVVARKI